MPPAEVNLKIPKLKLAKLAQSVHSLNGTLEVLDKKPIGEFFSQIYFVPTKAFIANVANLYLKAPFTNSFTFCVSTVKINLS